MPEAPRWHMLYRIRGDGLHALTGARDEHVVDALGTVARLADGALGITAAEAHEACLLVESYVDFIRRGLCHIEQERRVIWLEG